MVDEFDPRKQRKLVGWKAWYYDGSTYSSDKYTWEEIPQQEFECLKRYYKGIGIDGKETVYGEMWTGEDLYILDDEYRNQRKIPQFIKVGKWMKDEDFWPLFDNARNEKEIIEEMI